MPSAVSAEQVKELRDITGAGMMDCKQALSEAAGDLEKAKDILRKKGLASAQKRASREAKEGIIFLDSAPSKGVLVELNCETDFVAKTDDFQNLGKYILSQVSQKGESILSATDIQNRIQEASGKIGEKIAARRAVCYETKSGLVASYRHHNNKIGILVELSFSKQDLAKNEEVLKVGRDIAMQAAALRPQFLRPEDIKGDFLEREKAIFRDQVKDKPANVQDKIIEGKLQKRYEEICLLNQKSVIDNSKTVSQIVAELGKKLGDAITVKRFSRFEIGAE